jgi:PAS domain S-box-containing protein
MSSRIRAHDWASTPLGPIDAWPQSLKTVVGMMVAAPNPMVLLWGHEGTLIYNDGYARFAGRRHPELLGLGAREGWPEIADFNDSNIRRALAGEAWSLNRQELVLDRQGRLESAWLDLVYTPVPDETGRPAGLMVFVSEITDLVRAERRQAEERDRQDALIALDDAISETDVPRDIAAAAAAILGRTLKADRVGYGVIDPARESIDVVRDWRAAAETASVVGSHRFRDYGVYVEDIVAGRAVTIDDVRVDPRTNTDPEPLLNLGIAALLDAPLQEGGRTVAQMFVHSATPRVWTPEEIAFAREFGERARAAIARREAERDAAQRRDELQRLTDSLTVLVSFVDKDYRYQLNNAAYVSWFGPNAASLVGRRMVDVLGEAAYAKALPRMERALAGERLSFEDYLPYSTGPGRFIRADYVPRYDATGAVDGFYAVVSDISERKRSELRQQVLVQVADIIREETDPAALAYAASAVLGRFLGADRVGYGTIDPVAETLTVERDWISERAESVAGVLELRDWGAFIDDLKVGRQVRVNDVREDPRVAGATRSLEEAACRSFVNLPMREQGELVAIMFVNQATVRAWTDEEVALIGDVASRIRTAVERARAEMEQQEATVRQRALIELNDAIRDLTDAAEIEYASARVLAETLGVSRVGYGVMDTEAETIAIERDYNAPGIQSLAGLIHFRDFGNYIEDLARGETVIFADAAKDPRIEDGGAALAGISATSIINMPLVERGKVVALLFVNNATRREWTDGELALVREVAERVRSASERARAVASLQERERRLHFLDTLNQAVQSVDRADDILQVTMRMTGEHMGVSHCAYADMEADGEWYNSRGDWAAPGSRSLVGRYRLADFGGTAERELKAGRVLIINDVLAELGPEEGAAFEAAGVHATICVPRMREGRLTAIMAVHQKQPHHWTPEEVTLIREVSERSWAYIARAAAEAELRTSEARLRFLDGLAQAIQPLTDADAIMATTTRLTAEQMGVSICAYADMDEDQDGFTIRGDWAAPGSSSIVGRYRLRDFGTKAVVELSAGRPLILNDIPHELPPEEAATFQGIGISATICMPLVKDDRLTALMAVHHKDSHVWTDAELSLIREVVQRSWAHVERVAAEDELRASQTHLAAMFGQTVAGLAETDTEGRFVGVNDRYCEIVGRDRAALLGGMRMQDITHVDDLPANGPLFERLVEDGTPFEIEKRYVRPDGSYVWVSNSVSQIRRPSGAQTVLAVVIEVTERKRAEAAIQELNVTLEERVAERTAELMHAEEALRQSQKMEAIGQLTGGIAHDFNNLLAGISGSLELIEKRMAEGRLAGMDRYIQAAQGASRRAATLTQRLLAFSRRQTLDPKPTDVNRLVLGMEDLIRRSVGPDVRVTLDTAKDLWVTCIDASQLENALLNLCINSRDAMTPDGGDLTIRTYNVTLDAAEARSRDLPAGDYVKMSVTDTGSGMTPEVIAKAFDPFFTTKPLGHGTGLGLSMIHGFMRQSGGQVRIESAPGQGTTITLALPRWSGSADASETSDVEVVAEEPGHGETILVIDDEETVRMLVVEVLEDAGYSVLQAADGPAGLAILNSDERIDLLVSDVGLPGGMNGRQVADAARITRPDLKVLFITGYAENAVVAGDTLGPGMAVMTKPFQVAALGARIREMIEG